MKLRSSTFDDFFKAVIGNYLHKVIVDLGMFQAAEHHSEEACLSLKQPWLSVVNLQPAI